VTARRDEPLEQGSGLPALPSAATLASRRVLVVGGEAVTYHGYARFTGDVDLFYDRSPGGAQARRCPRPSASR